MIRRRDLLDDIYDYFKTEIENFNYENQKGMLDDLVDVILEINKGVNKVIKSQPKAGEWIPCSERLPEEDGAYLVSGTWESGKVVVDDCDFSVSDGYFDVAWNFDVEAWMPLPDPYREDGESDG